MYNGKRKNKITKKSRLYIIENKESISVKYDKVTCSNFRTILCIDFIYFNLIQFVLLKPTFSNVLYNQNQWFVNQKGEKKIHFRFVSNFIVAKEELFFLKEWKKITKYTKHSTTKLRKKMIGNQYVSKICERF